MVDWRGCLAAGLAASFLGGGAAAVELRGHGGPVRALAVDDAGHALTGSFDTRAILWDLDSGTAAQVMRLHEGSVTAVAFLPDGGIVTGGQEGRIAFWRQGEGAPARVLEAHAGPVTALAVEPSGAAVASSAWDRTARLLPLDGGAAVVLEGHEDNVNGVAFLPDGGLVTAGYDASLRYWRPDGTARGVVAVPAPLNALAVDGAGTVWAAAADGVLRAFDAGGAALGELAVTAAPLVSLARSPEGDLLAVGAVDGTLAIVEAAEGVLRHAIAASRGPVWSVAFDTGGAAVLAGGADHVVRAWDATTGAALGGAEAVEADRLGDGHGARVFRMCVACHTLDPDDGNRAGPTLHGIFGRRIATAEGYVYSEALTEMDIVWTPETVSELFEVGPMTMTPGTSMPEQRIPDERDRAALIEFLEEHTQ